MTAREVADWIHADRIGKMKWITDCPAHDDHELQLEIKDIPGCAALVRCGQGCSIEKIAKALGLAVLTLESQPTPEPDLEEMDPEEAVVFLRRKLKRQDQHQIACGQIRAQQREVKWLQRMAETARRNGTKHDDSLVKEALEELDRLRLIEKKWRA